MSNNEQGKNTKNSGYKLSENHIRNEKNSVKMMIVKMFHFIFDIGLFYVAFIWFRYHRFENLSTTGFRYNYFLAIGYGVLLLC